MVDYQHLASWTVTEPTEPIIRVHLASTWRHSCDECSFPIFHCSFMSMYYYLIINSNWRRKEWGRPGNRARKTGPFLCRLLLVLQQNAIQCCVMCVQFPQFMYDILCSFRPPLKQPTCAVNFVDNQTSFIICYLATNCPICSLLWEDVKLKLVMTFPQAPHQFPEITVFFAWASKEGKCQI